MREQLIEFLENSLGLARGEIEEDTPLYSSGLLDSFGMLEVLMFIEEKSGIRFNPEDLSLDNLDSVNRILSFVQAAKAAQP